MILIDSCMFIPLLRRGIDPAQEFSVLAEQDDICTCGVVRCETTRGIRAMYAGELLAQINGFAFKHDLLITKSR